MKFLAAAIMSCSMLASGAVQAEQSKMRKDMQMAAPALERYTDGMLLGEVWKRPGLSPRDRSIVTLAALIARNQTIEMAFYLGLALDNDVTPRELSEIITHLAFYSGWGNAMTASAVAKDVFAARHIGADQFPAVAPASSLPLDETAPAVETELSFEINAKGEVPPRPRRVTVWPLIVAVTAPESVISPVEGSMW
jgi:4-carboxymuconolactone decarboxylase